MNLVGRKVKIIVSEPWDWTENLFGTINLHKDETTLFVQLTKSIKGKVLTSDLIKFTTRHEKTTFKPLSQNYSVIVGGTLITNDSDKFDYIIIGAIILI
ncbi:MAG: hypothetical protein QM478_11090 [Flavobacteriaceae bacterium]